MKVRLSKDVIEELINYFCEFYDIRDISGTGNKGRKDFLYAAVTWAYFDDSIDIDKLFDKYKKYYQKLLPFTNIRECLKSLELVYNFRSAKHVYFEPLYAKFLENRNPKVPNINSRWFSEQK